MNNAYIIIVDDEDRRDLWLQEIHEELQEITSGRVHIHAILGVRLAGAAGDIVTARDNITRAMGYVAGYVLDVVDRGAPNGAFAGRELLAQLRGIPGYEKGSAKIALVTVAGHVSNVSAPDADAVIARLHGPRMTTNAAALRLLELFELTDLIPLRVALERLNGRVKSLGRFPGGFSNPPTQREMAEFADYVERLRQAFLSQ